MVDFELKSPRIQPQIQQLPFHQWVSPDGAPQTQFFRFGTGYLLRFQDIADFQVSMDGSSISCLPTPGVAETIIQHLYLDQVLPLALSQAGMLVFHASAIEVRDYAIAFLAESGRGKSTLAASFAVSGYRILTDDGLIIEAANNAYMAIPSYPSIRLWKDSQEMLIPTRTENAPSAGFSTKARLQSSGDFVFCDLPRPLQMIYFLGDGSPPGIEFHRLTPAKAHIELVKHSFLLEVEKKTMLANHFGQTARLASQLDYYYLDYPRRFEDLKHVRHAILEHSQNMRTAR